MRKTIVVGFMVVAALWSPLRSDAVVFIETFSDGTIDPAITSPTPLAVDVSPLGEQFLGLSDASNRGLANTTVNLAVDPTPYTAATLAFSLYIIATMDGDELFRLSDNTGALLDLRCNNLNSSVGCTSFNVSSDVSNLTVLMVPPTTGFTDFNGGAVDESAYVVALTINRSSARLSFDYSNLQADIDDESWGLDNIALITNSVVDGRVPEPGTLSLVALGLLGLGGLAVRRRRG
jgi:hypothetical protein